MKLRIVNDPISNIFLKNTTEFSQIFRTKSQFILKLKTTQYEINELCQLICFVCLKCEE